MACRRQVASRLGGKTRLPGDVAADDAQCSDERHAERVELFGVGGLIHQRADRVVGQQQRQISWRTISGLCERRTR